MSEHVIRCRTAGQVGRGVDEYVDIDVRVMGCGEITNGLRLAFSSLRGTVVINFDDFERAYLAAKSFREWRTRP